MTVNSEQAAVAENPLASREAGKGDNGSLSLEKETESVATILMRKPVAGSGCDPFDGGDAADTGHRGSTSRTYVQRKCDECEEEDEELQQKQGDQTSSFIQSKTEGTAPTVSDTLSKSIESSGGGGESMDIGTESFMSGRFGANFSNVRIHNDDQAAQMSRELGARAFTVGNDIYFNNGQYQPHSSDGKRLLAHELTHTLQQGASVRTKMIQKADEVGEYKAGGLDASTPIPLTQYDDTTGKSVGGYNYWYRNLESIYPTITFDLGALPKEMTAEAWNGILSRAWELRPATVPTESTPGPFNRFAWIETPLGAVIARNPHRAYCYFKYLWDAPNKKPALELKVLEWVLMSKPMSDLDNAARTIPKKVSQQIYDKLDAAHGTGFPGGLANYFKAHKEVRQTLAGYIDHKFREYENDDKRTDLYLDELSELTEDNGSTKDKVIIHLVVKATKGGVYSITLQYATTKNSTISADYQKKDYADFQIEDDARKNPNAADKLGAIRGLDTIANLRERAIVKNTAAELYTIEDKSNKKLYRDVEIDQTLTISSGTAAAPVTELNYYTFIIHKADSNNIVNIDVKKIGKKGDAVVGDPTKKLVSRIPGYAENARDANGNETPDKFVKWLLARYRSLKETDIKDTTIQGIENKIHPLIEAGAGTTDWYKNNYSISILDATDARKRMKDLHKVPDTNLNGLKAYTVDEMKHIELSLQRFDMPIVKLMSGVAFIRQEKDAIDPVTVGGRTSRDGSYKFNKTTKVIISSAIHKTIAMYDIGFKEGSAFLGGVNGVDPQSLSTLTHEMGHVAGANLVTNRVGADTFQDRFNEFYKDLTLTPITAYSRDNKDTTKHSTETEYFPEAFMLFSHDPEWLLNNQFQTYFWFLHLHRTGKPLTLAKAKSLVTAWEAQKKANASSGLAEAIPVYQFWKELDNPAGKSPAQDDIDTIPIILTEFNNAKKRLPRSEEIKPIITKWKAFVKKNKSQPVAADVVTFFP